MTKKAISTYRVIFLLFTSIPFTLELWYALDDNPQTEPWTDLIVSFIPWPIALLVYLALIVWLPLHFGPRYIHKYFGRHD